MTEAIGNALVEAGFTPLGDDYAASVAAMSIYIERLKAINAQLLEALKRIGDPRMWRNRNGELTWAGETPDGNEIETDSPVAIARAAIAAAEEKN